uniref:Uncharacterized protein n=1 Tax=Anguilla anguilla TaxID=7936 RepID=A0A0E9U7N4_ANGAN
MPNLNRKKK